MIKEKTGVTINLFGCVSFEESIGGPGYSEYCHVLTPCRYGYVLQLLRTR